MEITSPEIQSAQEQLEQAKNRLTLHETELLRVQKLRIAEEYTIGELQKEKQELESKIDNFKLEHEKYTGLIDSEKEILESIKKESEDLKKTISEQTEALNSEKQTVEETKKVMQEAKLELEKERSSIAERMKTLEESETKLKSVVEQLKLVISTL